MIALTDDTADVSAACTPEFAVTEVARVMTYSNSAGRVTCVANLKTVRPSSTVSTLAVRKAYPRAIKAAFRPTRARMREPSAVDMMTRLNGCVRVESSSSEEVWFLSSKVFNARAKRYTTYTISLSRRESRLLAPLKVLLNVVESTA